MKSPKATLVLNISRGLLLLMIVADIILCILYRIGNITEATLLFALKFQPYITVGLAAAIYSAKNQ
ncbi:MAG: hypothetical protein LKE44_08215 [Eubacterium sp.]|jgi:flagellar biosynthesis protein FliQ|nr:hypothetical protein [Eubacterium sp.]